MNQTINKFIHILYGLVFLWTAFLILGLQTVAQVNTHKDFPLENAGFLMIGCAAGLLVYCLNEHRGVAIERFLADHSKGLLAATLALLLCTLLYGCYGGYVQFGWDVGVIRETVLCEFTDNYDQIRSSYYRIYPNNMFIVWLYLNVVRVANLLGMETLEFAPVVLQCVLDVIMVWLVWRITYDLTHSYRTAWLAYVVTYLFVGSSPWFMVPYSDATGVVFPVFLIRLYQMVCQETRGLRRVLYLFLLGFGAIIGYHVKPQIVITLIAIAMIELVRFIGGGIKDTYRRELPRVIIVLAGILAASCLYNYKVVPSLHVGYEPGHAVGWQHYLMMGLNEDKDGTYSEEDQRYIHDVDDSETRNALELQEAMRRIRDYGLSGMIRRLSRKQLVNYGDGTFAWYVEGPAIAEPEWADNAASDLVRSFILPEREENYTLYISGAQLLWVMILILQLPAAWYGRRRDRVATDPTTAVMMLSILGLTAFGLLFEARARYLFCYAPVYVILAAIGYVRIARRLRDIHKGGAALCDTTESE